MSKIEQIVFVVDDDPSFRRSVERLVHLAGYMVNGFGSADEFLMQRPPEEAACLITDLRMPGITGLDLQQELASAGWHIPVIFITGHGDVSTSVRAMKAGAIEFLTKPFHDQELLAAIGEALTRDQTRRGEAKRLANFRQRYDTLTPREREVMSHVIRGKLNKQIAADLNIGEKTIKFHRANIMAKMQVP
ncbi:MAG TPA: response regulator, partial [Candidatus Acidoferrum sp.]